jgi:hypothetical protein
MNFSIIIYIKTTSLILLNPYKSVLSWNFMNLRQKIVPIIGAVTLTALTLTGCPINKETPKKDSTKIIQETGIRVEMQDFNNDGKTDFFIIWNGPWGAQNSIMYMESNKEGKYTTYFFDSVKPGQVSTGDMSSLPKEIIDYLNSKK